DAVAALLASDADSLRSVTPAEKTPYKMWTIAGGHLQPVLGTWESELFNQPRQSLPTVFLHDGVIDVVRTATLVGGSMTGRRVLAFLAPEGIAVDIDGPDDLRRVEELLARLEGDV